MFTSYVIEILKEKAAEAGYGDSAYGVGKYLTAHWPDSSWPNHQINQMMRGELIPGPDKACAMLEVAGLEPVHYVFCFAVDAAIKDKRTQQHAITNYIGAEILHFKMWKQKPPVDRMHLLEDDNRRD